MEKLFCPASRCSNHVPTASTGWFHYYGSYTSCGQPHQRYRRKQCGKTFSRRTPSIDYWTRRKIDYGDLITHFVSGYSIRGLARYFRTHTHTIQNRFGRLARNIIATFTSLHHVPILTEHVVADGLEHFCVSQDFPNNMHLLVGKQSQFLYGFNYALMRRKGRKTDAQKTRCEKLYHQVDFTRHTIKRTFKELLVQLMNVAHQLSGFCMFTDEKRQYQFALDEDPFTSRLRVRSGFSHITVNAEKPRTVSNDLFSVNYLDRETVCATFRKCA
jgi:transposase-like protein